jgi:hypothetical protein
VQVSIRNWDIQERVRKMLESDENQEKVLDCKCLGCDSKLEICVHKDDDRMNNCNLFAILFSFFLSFSFFLFFYFFILKDTFVRMIVESVVLSIK